MNSLCLVNNTNLKVVKPHIKRVQVLRPQYLLGRKILITTEWYLKFYQSDIHAEFVRVLRL